ncbi:hypothetical protein Q9L58_010673, partial [Maublancomyces gigas]
MRDTSTAQTRQPPRSPTWKENTTQMRTQPSPSRITMTAATRATGKKTNTQTSWPLQLTQQALGQLPGHRNDPQTTEVLDDSEMSEAEDTTDNAGGIAGLLQVILKRVMILEMRFKTPTHPSKDYNDPAL